MTPFRKGGSALTPRGRIALASVLTILAALLVALSASGPNPDAIPDAGEPLPPLTSRAAR